MTQLALLYFLLGLVIGIIAFLFYRANSVSKSVHESMTNNYHELKNNTSILHERNSKLTEELTLLKTQTNDHIQEKNALHSENAGLLSSLSIIKNQVSQLSTEIQEQKTTNNQQQEEILRLHRGISASTEMNKSMVQKLENQKKEIEDFRTQSNLEFQNIANKIFEEKSEKFAQTNKDNIENILKPLGENIDNFKKKVEETYDKESKERFSLEGKVKELIELNNKLSNEANNLTSALKGQSKKQGNWGEIILESILDKSGLKKNREYFTQETITSEDGRQLRPDVIIHLPENRKIIIDSKVSLVHYERYCSEDNQELQDNFLKQHIQSVYQHVDDLSKKKYDALTESLDFTMMFIPIEPAYLLAIQEDPELWSYAYNKRILLISPTNLIAALKLISDLWKREQQSRNALEIANQGTRMYEKFVGFLETMEDVGRHMNRGQDAYLKAVNQLKDGRGNLVTQALNLKKLGLNSNKEIPSSFLPLGEDDELELPGGTE